MRRGERLFFEEFSLWFEGDNEKQCLGRERWSRRWPWSDTSSRCRTWVPGFINRLHGINTDRVVSVALTAENFAVMETEEDAGAESGEEGIKGGDVASDDANIEPDHLWPS